MGNRSKDLLRLEHNNDSSSPLQSSLLVCGQKKSAPAPPNPDNKPSIGPLPNSQLLGKLKDFLGVFAESNRRLEHDAKENGDAVDIEVLSGKETNVIEMDLMLGVADLNTPEAVAAAESAVSGYQPVIPLPSSSSSGTESDYDSDCSNTEKESGSDDEKQRSSEVDKTDSGDKGVKRKQSNKRQKIIELL